MEEKRSSRSSMVERKISCSTGKAVQNHRYLVFHLMPAPPTREEGSFTAMLKGEAGIAYH